MQHKYFYIFLTSIFISSTAFSANKINEKNTPKLTLNFIEVQENSIMGQIGIPEGFYINQEQINLTGDGKKTYLTVSPAIKIGDEINPLTDQPLMGYINTLDFSDDISLKRKAKQVVLTLGYCDIKEKICYPPQKFELTERLD